MFCNLLTPTADIPGSFGTEGDRKLNAYQIESWVLGESTNFVEIVNHVDWSVH